MAVAESKAKASKLGLWVDTNPIPPWEFRKGKTGAAALGPSFQQKGAGPIIGNKKSHVYHYPACPSYNKVGAENRVYFPSRATAEAAGFREAGNCPNGRPGFKEYENKALQTGRIIGNRRSRIYHMPNCPSYDKVSPQNRQYFDSIP